MIFGDLSRKLPVEVRAAIESPTDQEVAVGNPEAEGFPQMRGEEILEPGNQDARRVLAGAAVNCEEGLRIVLAEVNAEVVADGFEVLQRDLVNLPG